MKVGKPNPEGFLKCAQMLNANPKECVVIEDAPSGIEAARRAGMKAVGLWTNHGRNYNLSNADLIVKSLKELNLKKLESL